MDSEKRAEGCLWLNAEDRKYFILLFTAIALVFWDVFLLKKAFLSGDHLIQHYPWAKFLQDHIHQFKLPWWTRELQCGFPLLAEGQIGAFYPLNLLFLALLPLKWAYNYEALFHFVLGACFVYAYVRSLGLSREASFLSALIFLFGSAEGGFFYNVTSQRVSIWFPPALLVAEKLAKKPSLSLASLLGIVHALQIVAGYQQIAAYTLAFTTFYFLLRIVLFRSESKETNLIKGLSFYGVSIFLALAVTAIQWFPLLQLSTYSSRAQATEPLAYLGSLPPFFIMTLLFPDWTGFWGGGGGLYVGILGFFFVLLALFGKKSQVEKLWITIFLVAVLLALGKYSPLYILIVKLFKIYYFRIPSKFLFFASTALAVLAGFGFDKFFKPGGDIRHVRRVAFALWGFFSLILVSIFVSHWIGIHFREPILEFLKNYVASHIFGQPYHPHSLDVYYEKLFSRYGFFLQLTSLKARQTFWPILLFIIQMSAAHFLLRKKNRRYIVPTLLALIFMDLLIYVHQNTRRDLGPYERVEIKSQLVDQILRDKGIFRIHEFNAKPLVPDLFPLLRNQNMALGLDDLGVYSPFAFSTYKRFLGDLGGVDDSLSEVKASISALLKKRKLIDQLNVRYVFSTTPLQVEGLKEIGKEHMIWLYQNESFWPRAFTVERIDQFPDFGSIQKVDILEQEEDRTTFDTEGLNRGYLVVSEQTYPGWTYYRSGISGLPISLGECFKAIPLTEGTGRTTLIFRQEHLRILTWTSLLGLFLACVGVLSRV